MVKIIVVHNKTPYHIELKSEWTVSDLKDVLHTKTQVPPSDQKLLGLGNIQNETCLKSIRIKENQKVFLLGSLDKDRSHLRRALQRQQEGEEDDEGSSSPLHPFHSSSPTVTTPDPPPSQGLLQNRRLPFITPTGAFDFISLLPKEIRLLIFSYLKNESGVHHEVSVCMQVCRKWCEAARDQFFWYNAFHNKWRLLYKVNEDWQQDWRMVYKKKWTLDRNWKFDLHRNFKIFNNRDYVRSIATDTRTWNDITSPHKKIVSACGTQIYLWDLEKGSSSERYFKGHKAIISSLETSGGIVISGDNDGNILLWDRNRSPEPLPWSTVSGELVASLPDAHKATVSCIKYDEDYFVSASIEGTVKVWDLNKCCFLYKLDVVSPPEADEETKPVTYIQLNAGDVLTASMDGIIRLWDLNSGKVQLILSNGQSVSCLKQTDLHTFYSSSPEQEEIRQWDMRLPSKPTCAFSLNHNGGGGSGAHYFEFDGSKFVAAVPSNVLVCSLSSGYYQDTLFGSETSSQVWALPVAITEHESILFTSSLLVMATTFGVLAYDYDL